MSGSDPSPIGRGTIECDVAVIGSGMGGSTFAHSIRHSGLKVLVVERGDFLPKEPENWDVNAVFANRRYHNAEAWIDGHNGSRFSPGVFYYVGGNTKFFGAMLPRFREATAKGAARTPNVKVNEKRVAVV